MYFLDKSLRELYSEFKVWLSQNIDALDRFNFDSVPWLEPLLLILAGLLAFYLAAIVVIAAVRLISYVVFRLDQLAHWLAGVEKTNPKPVKLIHVLETGRWRVQGYEPDGRRAAKRRREWQKKLLSEKEIQEIEEKNRSRL